MKNTIIDGVEVAPMACVVCGRAGPTEPNTPGWTYLAGSDPVGAIACSPSCTKIAINRHRKTGRVDTPEMRAEKPS